MEREKEKKRKVRYDTVMMLRLTREMYERLKEYADKRGLTVAGAVRLLIAEALMEDELKQRK